MPFPPVTTKEVDVARTQIHNLLEQAQTKSKKSGKPLLILVGENHELSSCALLETILYQEARALGVQNVCLETNKKFLSLLSRGQIHRSSLVGHEVIEKIASFYDAKIHPVDGRTESFENMIQELRGKQVSNRGAVKSRNECIAANLANIDRPILMIAGAAHLAGLLDKKILQDSHEVVAINVSQTPLKMPSQNALVSCQSKIVG